MSSEAELRELARAHGQEQVFAFWEQLDTGGREGLLGQLSAIDFALLDRLGTLLAKPPASGSDALRLKPVEVFPLERDALQQELARRAVRRGEELLEEGAVACLLVAGGQASRMGHDGPKGGYPVGPVSGWCLFEMHARRLLAAAERHGASVPCYVMTSPANDAATRGIFEQHDFFGLERDDLRFFTQSTLPALGLDGRILLAGRDRLFLAPNGHGGVLSALADSGSLEHARRRGVSLFSYAQVDNPLARPADPLFVGLHALEGARMSSKVLAKRDPAEGLGNLGFIDGERVCIEYSELPESLREERDEQGRLLFGVGAIAMHLLDLDFIDELTREGLELPWHVARKKMRVVGGDGEPIEVQGAKFESFVFDALRRSPKSITLEVERELEFCPVKNARGQDSPASARRNLCGLYARWVAGAGLELPPADDEGVHPVEVDPLLAEDAGSLAARGAITPARSERGFLYGVSSVGGKTRRNAR